MPLWRSTRRLADCRRICYSRVGGAISGQGLLLDTSSNGTYLNGARLPRSEQVPRAPSQRASPVASRPPRPLAHPRISAASPARQVQIAHGDIITLVRQSEAKAEFAFRFLAAGGSVRSRPTSALRPTASAASASSRGLPLISP